MRPRELIYKTMTQDLNITDIETRFAFLEDQLDALSNEALRLSKQNDILRKEMHALANLVKPMMMQISQIGTTEDQGPPPHY